ncbi:T9SS type A sorting domain-containing protein [Aureibaculum sp. A20]|uniref:T9SS type A sorting domain-containing protein n=1 Tax=Aureibaculum flavum TaxID=2795986 RepID=A0ABS0WM29_9FLAO|nr:T9SS type A sorting domain-containing protein [Aureibaculum flavum]MBJ2173011.1 T9SS type A sorting domain-containing protein [Aureibaculum flavum]
MVLKLRLTLLFLCFTCSILFAQVTVTDYLTGLNRPIGMAFDTDGNLFVAEGSGGNIIKATAPLTSSVFAYTGWNNTGLAIDNNGDVFVGESLFGQIFKITSNGSVTTYIGASDTDHNPWQLYFDEDNNMFYSNVFGDIVKVTPSKVFSDYATGFSTPEGFDFDSNGNLFIAARNEAKLIKVEPNGTKTTLLSGLYEIRAIVVDANDDVYYNVRQGFNTYKIIKYKQSDGSLEDIVVTGIESVNNMIFNDQGDLFIAHGDKVSLAQSLVTMSTEDYSKNDNIFKIYPNPSSDLVKISGQIANYTIYDITGKIVMNGSYNNNTIDITSLNKGVYLIELEDINNLLITKKIIKN